MITCIEARNYRCLRYIHQDLKSFHVLVGPNASGKSTFLDVIAFLGRLVSEGLDAAVQERTNNFEDLLWNRQGEAFELAIEVRIPEARRQPKNRVSKVTFDTVRYEVEVGLDPETREPGIRSERALLKTSSSSVSVPRNGSFPSLRTPPKTIMTSRASRGERTVLLKKRGGNDYFNSEVSSELGKGWSFPSIKLGPKKAALSNLPEDEGKFPVSTWLKAYLAKGVQQLTLNSLSLRRASPPGKGKGFRSDGSNLPWVIGDIQERHGGQLRDWLNHIQTALPELLGVRVVDREDDKHKYLMFRFHGGLEIPSWMASDGTLSLLALTLPAYLPNLEGVFLIEEPENGIHPKAVETVYQSLSSVYGAQVLMATHSPVILSLVPSEHVLCFAKTDQGCSDVVAGDEHPALKGWKGETNLGVLFAAGVLG